MAKGFAIHNAPTDHGGFIPSTQVRSSQQGNLFVRAGDGHFCPKCKCWSTVVKSHDHVIFDGKAVAYVGDKLTCGARIQPQQSHVVGDSGSTSYTSASNFQPVNSQQNLNNSLVEDKEEEKEPCPPECIVETITFSTSMGDYIISKEAWKFILSFEGFESIPYVPKNSSSSGVTLGYGYDLGQQSPAQIQKDLEPYYTPDQIKRLVKLAQGKKGNNARAVLSQLSDIKISKEAAGKMIVEVKQRYAQQVVNIYPEVLQLHPHCQGMLLDLIYNRGNGLKDRPDQLTRLHMRQIQDAFKASTPEKIPDILRDMAKLWAGKGLTGLVNRRKDEANWFEKGLKCDCYK